MKKIVLISSVLAFVLCSCGADQASVDKMTEEMCSAMELYKKEDPSSMLRAAGKMSEIAGKQKEYGSVTESQLNETMQVKCADGFLKFQEITSMAQ